MSSSSNSTRQNL